MHLPRVFADFNGDSLATFGTQEDLKRQGIQLVNGARYVFYDFDEQNGERGFVHADATVWWDAHRQQFRMDTRKAGFRFTPDCDISVLDELYP